MDQRAGFIGHSLSPLEQELVDDIVVHASFQRTPEFLFERWQRLVDEVEHLYDDIVDEYINDLDTRNRLEDALSVIAPPRAWAIVETIRPWDLRFYEATSESRVPMSFRRSGPLRWWYYRVPASAGSGFRKHLRQLGLVDPGAGDR